MTVGPFRCTVGHTVIGVLLEYEMPLALRVMSLSLSQGMMWSRINSSSSSVMFSRGG